MYSTFVRFIALPWFSIIILFVMDWNCWRTPCFNGLNCCGCLVRLKEGTVLIYSVAGSVTLYPFTLEGKELSTLFSFKSRISGTSFCCWVVNECGWWQQPDTGIVAIVNLLLFQLSFKERLYLHLDSNARGPESKLSFGLTGSYCVILFTQQPFMEDLLIRHSIWVAKLS